VKLKNQETQNPSTSSRGITELSWVYFYTQLQN